MSCGVSKSQKLVSFFFLSDEIKKCDFLGGNGMFLKPRYCVAVVVVS
jgi:hypothetical protein